MPDVDPRSVLAIDPQPSTEETEVMTAATTAREATIAQLLRIRESAVDDLRTMPLGKIGSEWQADRVADIISCNRQLERLGAIPATGS